MPKFEVTVKKVQVYKKIVEVSEDGAAGRIRAVRLVENEATCDDHNMTMVDEHWYATDVVRVEGEEDGRSDAGDTGIQDTQSPSKG